MGDTDKAPSQLSQVIKLLTEISGYVAGIVAYFLAITGRMKTDFPNSVAILTLIVTMVVLWTWRWSEISRRKPVGKSRSAKPPRKNHKQPAHPIWQQWMEPLRSSDSKDYSLPLTRRRVEVGFMGLLTVLAIGRIGTQIPNIVHELNPPPYMLKPPCNVAEKQTPLRAVIADFLEVSSYELLFEQRLYDEMLNTVQGEVEICRLEKVIEDSTQALAAQEGTDAAILIWGRSDAEAVDVFLEVRGWSALRERVWSFRHETSNFQAMESEHLTFLTQFSFSLIRFLNGQYAEARQGLELALDGARGQQWTQEPKYAADFADGYFLLGLIYYWSDEPVEEQTRLEKSRQSYETAVTLNPAAVDARYNLGFICMELEDRECAVDAFARLIEYRPPLSEPFLASVYISRSYLQPQDLAEQDLDAAIKLDPEQGYSERGYARLRWGDLKGAADDLKMARQLTPEDSDVYQSLGKVQLLTGDFTEAIKTYTALLQYLPDSTTRQFYVDELKSLAPPAGADAGFKDAVEEIVRVLEEAQLP